LEEEKKRKVEKQRSMEVEHRKKERGEECH
jgi:hypothetical protein